MTRTNHVGDVGHPVAHGRTRQFHAVPADDAFQTIQRLMVRILAGGDVGQQAGSGDALVDDGHGNGSRSDMVMTLLASVLEANVLPDEQTGRLIIELLRARPRQTSGRPRRSRDKAARLRARCAPGGGAANPWAAACGHVLGVSAWRQSHRPGRCRLTGSASVAASGASSGKSQGWLGSKRSALGP